MGAFIRVIVVENDFLEVEKSESIGREHLHFVVVGGVIMQELG
jgi:hypothetical protein